MLISENNVAKPAQSLLQKKVVPIVLITNTLLLLLIFTVAIFAVQLKVISRSKSPVTELKPNYSGSFKAGIIGEEEASTKFAEFPQVLYNTSGKIKEIRTDRIIITGSGASFADQQPRDLILLVTSSTITNTKDGSKSYTGSSGLMILKSGMEILVEGAENIRGKTEFMANYINIL
jgi:hypothetical protein